jgi:nitrite transporter NirC
VPVPIDAALDTHVDLSVTKANQAQRVPKYLFASALAGAYVGVAVVLLVSVSAPLVATSSAAAKLVQAAVFGVALTLVVFAGAELFTGNVMVMLQGLVAKRVRMAQVASVFVLSLIGNFIGSIAFAGLVFGAGTLNTGPGAELINSIVTAKSGSPGAQLFWRAVLCNMLVCLGLWMASRTKSEAAKLIVLWWALLAFIGSGFEHSIANMTIFGLGVLQGSASWSDLGFNLVWTVPGNIVGGGLIVGLGYAWLGHQAKAPALPSSGEPMDLRHEAVAPAGNGLELTPDVVEPSPQPTDRHLDGVGVRLEATPRLL